jgi:hypothetical protein
MGDDGPIASFILAAKEPIPVGAREDRSAAGAVAPGVNRAYPLFVETQGLQRAIAHSVDPGGRPENNIGHEMLL